MNTISSRQAIVLATLIAAAAPAAHAVPISGQGTWETTLQSRDINSDGNIDAYFDTVLNITWLKDANFAKTTGHAGADSLGRMNWADANTWAAGLNVHGVNGWTLPGVLGPYDGRSSELANLYYTTMGNALFNGDNTNTGPFVNWQLDSALYWYNTAPGPGTDFTQRFTFVTLPPDHQGTCLRCGDAFSPQSQAGYAWAVHAGDVAPVPEPETYAMMLAGLGALAFAVRRKKRRGASR